MKKTIFFFTTVFVIAVSVVFFMNFPIKKCNPAHRELAITIDDLPIESLYFKKISQSLKAHKAPAIGFVIANAVNESNLVDLKQFLKDGFEIGNHSYSHMSLRKNSASDYIADVAAADKILAPLMTGTKYYRYPYLAQARWRKKQKVLDYLAVNHYVIAPITIDSKDYEFNAELIKADQSKPEFLAKMKQRYFDFVLQQTLKAERKQQCNAKQILLLHANQLNSYFLDDLLTMFEKQGYHFITLKEALA
ncbi:MAG: polysaccharide deacetylase family protein [Tatlockia sp.]|nr:polysaccharide deacetylase family protein [Tatlockia sp.]